MSKLIIFDLGDVVMLGCRALRDMAKELGVDSTEFLQDYRNYNAALMDGWCSTQDYYRHLEIKYKVKVNSELFIENYNPSINAHMIDVINALRSKGHRCVAGSNTFQCYTEWTNRNIPTFFSTFSHCYLSNEIHRSKPDSSFFEYIMDSEGFASRDTYFIDDRSENVAGAMKLGINAHLYTGDDEVLDLFLKDLF